MKKISSDIYQRKERKCNGKQEGATGRQEGGIHDKQKVATEGRK